MLGFLAAIITLLLIGITVYLIQNICEMNADKRYLRKMQEKDKLPAPRINASVQTRDYIEKYFTKRVR